MDEERKKRLLLVEDEETLRSTLRMNFELEGYDVTTAVRGGEALERIRGARFDGIVLDVMLPDVDGFTICETIRLEGDRTPVLFLTARTTSADRVRGLRAGEDFLGKPFDLQELLLRVEKLVSRATDTGATGPICWPNQRKRIASMSSSTCSGIGPKRSVTSVVNLSSSVSSLMSSSLR